MFKVKIGILCAMVFATALPAFAKSGPVLEKPPSWYRDSLEQPYLDIGKLMEDGYTRLEAFELQNFAFDMMRSERISVLKALANAKKLFKKKEMGESGYFPPSNMAPSDFIVAFDLDETLLAQWYRSNERGTKYYDFCTGVSDKVEDLGIESPDCVKFLPGLERVLKSIKKIPGCRGIVLFSAKDDETSKAIIDKWKIDGVKARDFFTGIFTRNYLTRGNGVFKPSKDLRIIDESLDHVLIVDDNPLRLFQPDNVRVFPKFNAEMYLSATVERKKIHVIKFYERALDLVLSEIEDSYKYAKKYNITFKEACYPFTQSAQAWLGMVEDVYSLSKMNAADFLRGNRSLCNPQLYEKKIIKK